MKDEKRIREENLNKNKDKIHKKIIKSKQSVLKERKENEEYIKKRDAYYKKQAKEKVLNMTCELNSSKHKRAKSAINNIENKENEYQETLLMEIKKQQNVLQKLENLAKEEEFISNNLQKSKHMFNIIYDKSKENKSFTTLFNKKPRTSPLNECKFLLNL